MIPDGWQNVGVEDIILPNKGAIKIGPFGSQLKRDCFVEKGFKVYGQENVFKNDFNYGNRRINAEKYKQLQSCELKPGDIVITMMGTIGRCAIVPNSIENGVMDSHLLRIQIDTQKFSKDYFIQYLSSPAAIQQIISLSVGGIMAGLSSKIIKSLVFPSPPLSEQKRIAEVLGSVDAAIESTKAVIEQTRKVKQGLLQTLLTRGIGHTKFKSSPLGEIPEGWGIESIEGLLESCVYGISKSLQSENVGTPILRMGNIVDDKLILTGLKYADLTEESPEKVLLQKGDIVFNRTNSKDLVGKVAFVDLDQPLGFASYLLRLRTKQGVDARWFFRVLSSPKMQAILRSIATPGVSQVNINPTRMRELEVPVPPYEEQQILAKRLDDVDTSINAETAKLASLQQLKKGLMHDLLTGKVRVSTGKPALKLVHDAVPTKEKTVQPAFKRAVLAAEITYQLYQNPKFGSVKLEKIIDLCERHLDLDGELDRNAYRQAAGPYDNKAKRSIESNFKKQKWFDVQRVMDGKKVTRVNYIPLENCGQHKQYFERYFGHIKAEIQEIINLLRPMNRERCEIVATLYASWNDFLLKGELPDDETIVNDVLHNWHDNKRQISKDRWLAALPWMRDNKLVPHGSGRGTRGTKS